jgi:hypothetical protein
MREAAPSRPTSGPAPGSDAATDAGRGTEAGVRLVTVTPVRRPAAPPADSGPGSGERVPITVSIGRIEVEIASPPPPPRAAGPGGAERTHGFDRYAAARRGRPR